MNIDHKIDVISNLLPHFHNINDREINSQNLELDLLKDCYDFAFAQGLSNAMVAHFTKSYHQLLQDTILRGNMHVLLFELQIRQ